MIEGRTYLPDDWYGGGVPANVELGENVYIDTSYTFAAFLSSRRPALRMGRGSGAYDRTAFVVGPRGEVEVGAYTCLNATYLVCHERITIGAHCLLAWGVVLTDSYSFSQLELESRSEAMLAAARHDDRWVPAITPPRPVALEDNVWVGFDSVILPGVTLGRGCIVGCKTVVEEDVPPYSVYVGSPGRVVRRLAADDTEEARRSALRLAARA